MLWVALVIVAVAGFSIYRLHGAFAAAHRVPPAPDISNDIIAFNPKQVLLEVFGAPGATATINYLDATALPQQVVAAPLPWSYTITTTEPAVMGNLVAQGDSDVIGCRITVNGVVKDERTVHNVNGYIFCLDKSG